MSLPGTYVPDVPQGTQQINNTQQPINTNFQDIYDFMAVNHTNFNTTDTFGTHTIVDFVTQTGAPGTGASEVALYNQIASNGVPELFVQYANNAGSVQLTPISSSSSSTTAVSAGSFYWATTANYVYWMQFQNNVKMYQWLQSAPSIYSVPAPTVSPYTFSFPTASGAPAFTQTPFNVQISIMAGVNPATAIGYSYCCLPISASQFHLYYTGTPSSSASPFQVFMTAIGV